MEHWGPLLQTALWVVLIGGIAVRFHKPIHGLLEALTERIKAGSDVALGPLSLKTMQSLPMLEQTVRANLEIEEANVVANTQAILAAPEETPAAPPIPIPTPSPQFRAQYFQAEDLALRAVQAEFGQPISRQVTGGHDQGFDGAFVLNNRLNIVEVKYAAKTPPTAMFLQVLHQVQSFVSTYNLKSVNLVLVAVVDRTADIEATLKRLTAVADQSPLPTIARVYALSELQAKFGIVD